jgi:type IV pilus assembly protein PilA
MKKIMEMLQNMKAKNEKKDNNGFSLVELIIVIAIMAILVGVVGTQVIPYINKSKESKDFQIISSYGTAAMTAYSSNADKITVAKPASGDTTVTFNVYGTNAADPEKLLSQAIKDLTYAQFSEVKNKFKSDKGKDISDIKITYNFTKKTITAQAVDSSGNNVLDAVVSDM